MSPQEIPENLLVWETTQDSCKQTVKQEGAAETSRTQYHVKIQQCQYAVQPVLKNPPAKIEMEQEKSATVSRRHQERIQTPKFGTALCNRRKNPPPSRKNSNPEISIENLTVSDRKKLLT